MIKTLLSVLIVANVVIYLWGKNMVSPEQTTPRTRQQADVPSILLAQELVVASNEPEISIEVINTEVTTEVADDVIDDVIEETTEVVVAEAEIETEIEVETEKPPIDEAPPTQPAEKVCGRLGPFTSQSAAEKTLATLTLDSSNIEQKKTQLKKGYWVLIPALPSRAAAKEMVLKLAEKGFDDVWLFNSGPLKNAISLGLFNQQENAKQHASSINKKGFATEVRPKTSRVTQYWADYSGIKGIIGIEKLSAKVSHEKKACN